jgi:hypothetical protein
MPQRRLLAAACVVAIATPQLATAQTAPEAAPDARTLARYDKNGNGRLDPEELAALQADQARAAQAATSTLSSTPLPSAEIVELSPFQVSGAADKGYYASNTLSGTRINSKLEDLGASISVVTKQQMEDFAMLDLNDVFLYEANTEGTGNYTDMAIDRNGVVTDNVASDPSNANRVRGIGAANQARGNFEVTRTPFDPSNIDAVEISRGPNSNLFGLGNGSGTVNVIPAQANLSRERSSLELRTDSLGGTRASLDLNRPIFREKLALRVIGVHQDDEYVRKPSYSRTDRYSAMVQYRPFKNTTLRASFERYENLARRPNTILPRDGITYWKENGSPTWDPSTWTVTRNGVRRVVPYNATVATENAALGPGLASPGTALSRPIIFVDRGGEINLWMTAYISGIPAPTAATPNPLPTPNFHPTNGHQRFIDSAPAPRVGPLAQTIGSIADRSVYDWTETNLAAANWMEDTVNTWMAEFDQIFINSRRHVLAAQIGWFREDAKKYNRSFIGTSGASAMVVMVDVNEKLLDGRPNPNFLRPYINAVEPTVSRSPFLRDIYRAQIAYKLNLTGERSWLRWLGEHALSGYGEYKDTDSASYRFRDVMVSNHAWMPANTYTRADGIAVARATYRYYLGDNQGQNIEYGSPAWKNAHGTHGFTWFNAGTNQWVVEPTTIGEAFMPGVYRRANVIKSRGLVLQNHLLNSRLVTTFGWRNDANFNRNAASTGVRPDRINPDYSSDDVWNDDWFRRNGATKTLGAVVKPFRGWDWIEQRAGGGAGLTRRAADFVRSLTFHYNKADSFRPATIAQNLNLVILPNPTSQTMDRGVSFALANQLVVRVNLYENTQINSRTGDAGTIATRAGRIDFPFGSDNDPFNLQSNAREWIIATTPGLTPQALDAAVAAEMRVPVNQLALMNAYPIAETSDVVSKGTEIEISYNPTNTWTMRANVAEQKVVEQGVTPGIQQYIDARRPVWETIIDKRTGQPWFTSPYGRADSRAIDFLESLVLAPYKLLTANEGKSRPQIRRWRFNALTNFQLRGITENKWLRRVAVSGAVRWEDKGAIGYYAYANDPNAYDPNRVIYDQARYYFDGGISYDQKILRNKIGLRLQLNVRNLFEDGRLQAVAALPNGQPHTYRIIDPRTFILTARFSL